MARQKSSGPQRKSAPVGSGKLGKRKPASLGLKHAKPTANEHEQNLRIKYQTLSDLTPSKNNSRVHSKKQIGQIAESMVEYGFTSPILVDSKNRVIAGHARLDAARLAGLRVVPTICLDNLTEAQIRACLIAGNRLAEHATWDLESLQIELNELIELDFNLELTGFETPDLDVILSTGGDESALDPDDESPEPSAGTAPVSQLGDLWQLGKHRLYCGDATKGDSFEALLGQDRAAMVFTDPPYNVKISGHVSGLGSVKHREFPMASGEMSEKQYTAFLKSVFELLTNFTIDGSIHFLCMDWRHIYEILTAARDCYSKQTNLCVWGKTSGGGGDGIPL